jgi:hypothetical protein
VLHAYGEVIVLVVPGLMIRNRSILETALDHVAVYRQAIAVLYDHRKASQPGIAVLRSATVRHGCTSGSSRNLVWQGTTVSVQREAAERDENALADRCACCRVRKRSSWPWALGRNIFAEMRPMPMGRWQFCRRFSFRVQQAAVSAEHSWREQPFPPATPVAVQEARPKSERYDVNGNGSQAPIGHPVVRFKRPYQALTETDAALSRVARNPETDGVTSTEQPYAQVNWRGHSLRVLAHWRLPGFHSAAKWDSAGTPTR